MFEIVLGLVLGIIVGGYGYKTLFSKKKGLNTDVCMEFLKSKGYVVNLKVQDKNKQ